MRFIQEDTMAMVPALSLLVLSLSQIFEQRDRGAIFERLVPLAQEIWSLPPWHEAQGDYDRLIDYFSMLRQNGLMAIAFYPSRPFVVAYGWGHQVSLEEISVTSSGADLTPAFKEGAKVFYITAIAVHEAMRGQGIAARLLQAIIDRLRKEGELTATLMRTRIDSVAHIADAMGMRRIAQDGVPEKGGWYLLELKADE